LPCAPRRARPRGSWARHSAGDVPYRPAGSRSVGRDWPSCPDFGPATPGIIPRRRDAHHIAHDANWEHLALIRDEAEFHLGASEKMSSVFFRISRSMRRRSFSRRKRAFSAAKSAPAGGIAACVFGRQRHRARSAASKRRSRGSTAVRCSPATLSPPV
jgi:hypothetical protein